MAPSLFLQLAALSGAAAMQSVHRPHHTPKKRESFRQALENLGDVQYTGEILVGGQTLKGILDTGSFELLVLSKECQACGNPELLFSSNASKTYESGNVTTEHNFGSGTTFSIEAFDTVTVGPLESRKQHFWQVYDAMMPILEESSFQAIVGVGPPDSARKLAEESEENPEDDVEEALVAHAHKKKNLSSHDSHKVLATGSDPNSVCSSFGVQTFSVCMGKGQGSDGYFVWNDKEPRERDGSFKEIEVSGEIHWASRMTDVQVGSSGDEPLQLGCEDGCAAVLDSGTSLIAAPMAVIEKVQEAIQTLNEDCSNLGEMPDLVFTLSGQEFSLPPDAYIGQIVDNGKPGLRDILHFRFRSRRFTCMPLFMNMDVDSQLGPMWILGLPFFRKYYTTFSYDIEPTGIKKHMAAAVADDSCEPAEGTHLASERRFMQPKRIDLAQLRVPQWVERAIEEGQTGRKFRV